MDLTIGIGVLLKRATTATRKKTNKSINELMKYFEFCEKIDIY